MADYNSVRKFRQETNVIFDSFFGETFRQFDEMISKQSRKPQPQQPKTTGKLLSKEEVDKLMGWDHIDPCSDFFGSNI